MTGPSDRSGSEGSAIHPKDDPRTLEDLISAGLGDVDDDSTWDAIFALRWRGTREVFDRASALCRSVCPAERALGAQILAGVGVPDHAFPEESLAILLGMLKIDQDHGVLAAALTALGHLNRPQAIALAEKFRRHPDPDVRHSVLFTMLGCDDPIAIEILIGLTEDVEPFNRDWACFGLGTQIQVNTLAIREALARRLDDEDDTTRGEAMVGLARRGDPRVVPALLARLKSETVRGLEIEAASLIADAILYPSLLALRDWWDDDPRLLEEAIVACSPVLGCQVVTKKGPRPTFRQAEAPREVRPSRLPPPR